MVELVAENAASEGRNTVTEWVPSSVLVELLRDNRPAKAVWPVAWDVDESDSGIVK